MGKNVALETENFLTPIVESLGYELLEVELTTKYEALQLIVYIDKEGGITLDDCEKVHRAIDAPLDELDPTGGKPYNLNVSSPGIDRPLKNIKDYKRNIGKEVEVSLFKPIDGKKKFAGIFLGWGEDSVTVAVNGTDTEYKLKDITIIRPVVKI